MTFNADSDILVIGTRHTLNGSGRLHVIERPATGTWADINADTSPDVWRRNNISQAIAEGGGGSRLLMAHDGTSYLSDAGCTSEVVDGQETVTCPITLSETVVVPEGTPDGTFTISGQVIAQLENVADSAVTLSDDLELRIGAAPQLSEARLELANDERGTSATADDRPYPAQIERGERTRLRLRILNDNGSAAAPNSIASVLLTTTLGGLTSLVENGACTGSGPGVAITSCAIPADALTAANADKLLVELAHTGKVGSAAVWATVVGQQGETLTSERLTIDIVGLPTALAIAEPAAALLGYAPTDSTDPRNKATLAVNATDAAGHRATVPATVYSAKLTDSDGKTVALTGTNRKAEVDWPLRQGDAADAPLALSGGNPQARLTILTAPTAPLPVGDYTLELTAGSGSNRLTANQTLTVAGGAAALALSVEPMAQVARETVITVTATVTDANGGLVPDGTPVTFSEGRTTPATVLVLLSPARQRTINGQASVRLQAVSGGNAYVKADADNASGAQTITVTAPAPPNPLTTTAPNTFAVWTGDQPTTAAQLLSTLEGISNLRRQIDGEWVGYAIQNNRQLPGSVNFPIPRGTPLWLGAN